ncbi:host cell division inhibitor Icd-like protein [Dickeya fangzhongdai]|uniref:host cell division inhibitor Icd-like protein n=1 Tax=Dickeya fangzhongdai TaxID=1778540 RepID=UPI000EAFB603|nr:host cell division inhibitor Icd-like protein [Dickeya fangzhongdai]
MSSTPTQTHPEFVFLFLAVRRSDIDALPHRESVVAPDEQRARRVLARDYVLAFAGRLPVTGGRHV